MKKTPSYILITVLLFLLASCSGTKVIDDIEIRSLPTSAYLTKQEYDKRPTEEFNELMNRYITENELAPEKLPYAQVYKESELLGTYYTGELCQINMDYTADIWMQMGTGGRASFDNIIHSFPTKNVRRVDDAGNAYLLYMLPDGARLYLFFRNDTTFAGCIRATPVLMTKKLSYKDFEGLKIGDNIEKAAAIEPGILQYLPVFDSDAPHRTREELDHPEDSYWLQKIPLQSTHILTDGVLRIEYYYNEDGTYTVKNLLYGEDFMLPSYVKKINYITEGPDSYDLFRILDVDYVGGRVVLEKDSPYTAKDAVSETPKPNLTDVDWSVSVEKDGKTQEFTLADAEKVTEATASKSAADGASGLVKVYASSYIDGNSENRITTRVYQGVTLRSVLEALGITDAATVTVVDTEGVSHEFDLTEKQEQETILAWIENYEAVGDSESHVALALGDGLPDDFIHSVAKIIVK